MLATSDGAPAMTRDSHLNEVSMQRRACVGAAVTATVVFQDLLLKPRRATRSGGAGHQHEAGQQPLPLVMVSASLDVR